MSQPRPSKSNQRGGSMALPVLAVVLVAALAIAGAVWWRPVLYRTGLLADGGQPTVSPTFFDEPSQSPAPAQQGLGAQPAASPAAPGTDPTAAGLAKRLGGVPVTGMGTTTGLVMDATTGTVLWQRSPQAALVPASTMKLLTCTAALAAYGPEATFTTKVVQPAKGRLVLVGGGDPYLASTTSTQYPFAPSSATLAARTAAALKAQHVTTVQLAVDDSRFTGPGWNPTWPASYHDQVSTIGALWIDKGRATPTGAPTDTPALTAGQVFAAQLKANGITVTGAPSAAVAKATDPLVASISSLPLRTLVAQTLLHSDNDAAEVLLRQVGVATHNGGSFTGGVKGVEQTLTRLGVWRSGARLVDGSGLSRSNQVTAGMLAGVLHTAITTPSLAALVEGLPVAGVTGTLGARFFDPTATAGRGWVNAKTGTLTGVATLAGTTRTASGGQVVFAFMTNGATDEWGVRIWLDRMSSTVASCGC